VAQPTVVIVEKSSPTNLHIKTNACRDEAGRGVGGSLRQLMKLGTRRGGRGGDQSEQG
jgi:hypothetical protein